MATIFIFTLSTCPACKKTKNLLTENKVEFDHIDVDLLEGKRQEDELARLKKYNPNITFPTVIIDEAVIIGYDPDELKQKLGIV